MPTPTEALLARLEGLHPRSIDLSLGRIRRLLARLGHPERDLGAVVHIAGTNGKGSVAALLAAVQRAAGRRVNAYVSPHLVRFHERILVGGRPVADRALRRALLAAEEANAGLPVTFFEITTAAAFLAFREAPADITVLETGLGGRLDATNVVRRPRLCVITPVALDHRERLGPTLARIAAEKAGILRRGVPCVVGRQPPAAARAIAGRAAAVGAPLRRRGREWDAVRRGGRVAYRDRGGERRLPSAFEGRHQEDNAATVAACLAAVPGLGADDRALARGFARVRWPGRLQRVEAGPLAAALVPGGELWTDAGHNPAAARALAAWARKGPPLRLVCGLPAAKDARGFIRAFRGVAELLAAAPLDAPCWAPRQLARIARAEGMRARAFGSVEEAVGSVAGLRPPGRVLACGSFRIAARILAQASSRELSIQL